jgi:subtilisin family serine protease
MNPTTTKTCFLLVLVFLFSSLTVPAQFLVNKVWEKSYGLPDGSTGLETIFNPSGQLMTTGNSIVSGQSANLLLAQLSPDGDLLWQQEINHPSNSGDYGKCLTTDGAGNTIAAGACMAGSHFDFVVAKYAPAGNLLWTAPFNGPGNGDDVPVSMKADGNGNIYITGKSLGAGTGFDYATFKYSSGGALLWAVRYNFASGDDIPASLEISPTSGHVVVTGSSLNAAGELELATLVYNPVNGNLIHVSRYADQVHQFLAPTGLKIDSNGEVYLFGQASIDGVNWDIVTLCYNPGLQLNWVEYFDGSGLDDASYDLVVDNHDHVYVTGSTHNSQGGIEFITLKYDRNGVLLWQSRHMNINETYAATSYRLAVNAAEFVFVTGEVETRTGGTEMVTLMYAPDGEKKWVKHYTHEGYDHHRPAAILSDGQGAVYVTLESSGGGVHQYTTVKYHYWEHIQDFVMDTLNRPTFVNNEIIVRFDESLVNATLAGNRQMEFSSPSAFLPSGLISEMEAKIGFPLSSERLIKIFRKLTPDITTSITRLGDTIDVPPFWSAFVLTLPASAVELEVIDSLNTLFPQIRFAHLNLPCELTSVPNDPSYAVEQSSLHPTVVYPSAHVNAEPAWDIQVGQPFIRVGVYDVGVDYSHEDFGDGTFVGSKFLEGWDYANNIPTSAVNLSPNDDEHGTACAGIIGALTNNNKGIAGMAGGDFNTGNPGVTLVSMKGWPELETTSLIPLDLLAEAIVDGSIQDASGVTGFGLHVMSNSWRIYPNPDYYLPAHIQLIKDAVREAFHNNVIFVNSRGNEGDSAFCVPSSLYDNWIICVGASGTNGEFKDASNGSPSYSSSYGRGVDLIAPGCNEIVHTTSTFGNTYIEFNGTSAACPHVAGVAALIASETNQPGYNYQNIAQEDVEEILQRSASDRIPVGYDPRNGWGLLNAGSALAIIDFPAYKCQHFQTNVQGGTVSNNLFASNVLVQLNEDFGTIPAGNYTADIYKITAVVPHTIGANEVILDAWVRNSSSNLWASPGTGNVVVREPRIKLDAYTLTQATLSGYIYHLTAGQNGAMNDWIPFQNISDAKFAYTIYTHDPTVISVAEPVIGKEILTVFPNPASEHLTVTFTLESSAAVSFQIMDVLGRTLFKTEEAYFDSGIHQSEIELSDWAVGTYFICIKADEKVYSKTWVKAQ